MEIRHLITFRTVASTLNFTRAAEALNYVPSNVTMQIQALEEELGVPLIDRLGKQIALTEAGKKFLWHTEKIMSDLDEARLAVQKNEEITGTITISGSEILCAYRLPALFHAFRTQYPGVRFNFRPLPNERLINSLYEGLTDLIFILDEQVRAPRLISTALKDELFHLLVAPHHPLADRTRLQVQDLQEEVFLLTEKGCTYRTLFDRSIERRGIDGMTSLEFSSAEAIKHCAMTGMGIAFLPDMAVKAELMRGELVSLPWRMPDLHVVTQMLRHKDKWLSPAIEAFVNVVKVVFEPTSLVP
ncbi:LysR family transcriptional regulator [Paenibacillus piri]|uniref:LysR family transcriptional regulator n=1 Tax=Paenibacillus piri TaxID=2547395 RepID=A0A4R5KFE8_9BACL|nr:LysR family transcriptional regulator [Paenibacillus piri]TDF94023.1 LysR family transcriptional regulator [Paenibacillus piri]